MINQTTTVTLQRNSLESYLFHKLMKCRNLLDHFNNRNSL